MSKARKPLEKGNRPAAIPKQAHHVSKSNVAGPTRRSMRLRNLEEGIKLSEDHATQNESLLLPLPSTSRITQTVPKQSKISQALKKQPNKGTQQPSQTSRGQRSEHKSKHSLRQALPPVPYNKPQAQRSNSQNRKRKLLDDDCHSKEGGFSKKARADGELREQPRQQESQLSTQAQKNILRGLPPSQLASDERIETTTGSTLRQSQGQQSTNSLGDPGRENVDRNPISQWADTGFWPDTFVRGSSNMADENPGNGVASATGGSITAPSGATGNDTKDGKRNSDTASLNCDTGEDLAHHGVYLKDSPELEQSSRDFCDGLLAGEEKPIAFPCYPEDAVAEVLEKFEDENEAKLQMVIMPWVIPSAENLALQGLISSGDFTDQFDREWSCTVFGRSKPKPDYAVGVSNSVFSSTMYANLRIYGTADTPFLLTANLRFPFLIGEAKTKFVGLERANRQNVHSAAIAIRAIIKLYEAAFGPNSKEVEELFGKILVFTISHDSNRVEIYGHFATRNPPPTELNKRPRLSGVNGRSGNQIDTRVVQSENLRSTSINERPVNPSDAGAVQSDIVEPVVGGAKEAYYYRHLMALYDFRQDNGAQRFKAYNFVLNVYKTFGPKHKERILKAAKVLRVSKAKPKSGRSALTISELAPNDSVSAAPDKTALELQTQLDKMSALLEQQRDDSKAQLEQLLRQLEQQRADSKTQLEQQRIGSKIQLEQLSAQMEQQRIDSKEREDKLLDKIKS